MVAMAIRSWFMHLVSQNCLAFLGIDLWHQADPYMVMQLLVLNEMRIATTAYNALFL